MENACTLCYNLVLHNKPHSALKKISELKGSELYKCCCCYAYLHKHNHEWEIISGGDFMGSPESKNRDFDRKEIEDSPANELPMTGTDQVTYR